MTRRGQIAFFVPALGVFLVFVLLPATQTFLDSFQRFDGPTRYFVGGLYYRYAATDPQFRLSLLNNLTYMAWTLLFEVVVGLALAAMLEKESRLNGLLRVAFFSPNVLSLVVVGLLFGFLFKDGVGVFPGMLGETRALLTISLVSGWAYCGFFMVIFLAGLAHIPAEVIEAARLDGATGWTAFWRVKLPLLREVGLVAVLICFTGAFKAFDLFWVMAPNQDHTAIVSTLLVKEVIRYDNRGYGSTLSVLLTAVVLAIVAAVLAARRVWSARPGKAVPRG